MTQFHKKADVVIIGLGGIVGASVAHHLIERGWENIIGIDKSGIPTDIGSTGHASDFCFMTAHDEMTVYTTKYSIDFFEARGRYERIGGIEVARKDDDERMGELERRVSSGRASGSNVRMITPEEVKEMMPLVDENNGRFPVLGGLLQPRAGNARHDAVVWGYARAADRLGVDIIQNCEVTGFERDSNGRMTGVETSRGRIGAGKVAVAVAGHTSQVMQMAGLRLPVESHKLQAFVSESVKPIIHTVATFGVGHLYISQSDKGGLVFGGMLDGYNSFAQRGNLPIVEDVAEAMMMFLPSLGRVRLLRHWAGVVDMTMDGSPFICKTPIDGLYLNGGWNYTGFKAIPGASWCFAHTMATNRPHDFNAPFDLDRFAAGRPVDATGGGPFPNHH